MKVKELNLEETESSHTLGGAIVVYYKSIKRDTSRRRRVNQEPTRQVGHLQVQGGDMSRRCRLTGV
jgi:hypothetical protein